MKINFKYYNKKHGENILYKETGDIFMLYEVWNQTDYLYTAYRVHNAFLDTLVKETMICYPIRLHKTESIWQDEDGNIKVLESQGSHVAIYTMSFSPK